MGLLFKDDLHDEFGTWPLGYIPSGGADFGEVRAIGAAVGDGDDESFCDACEMMNRSLLNRRALDWLDAALGDS